MQTGPALASAGPIGSTFAGPHSVGCAKFLEGEHQIMIKIMINMKKRGPNTPSVMPNKGSLGICPTFIYPTETFHVRAMSLPRTSP